MLSNSTFFTILIIGMVGIFVALFAPLFISDDFVRARISAFISDNTGLEASVNGDVSLTLFPVLKIRAKEVSLNPGAESLLKRSPLTVREISVRISYGDLLAGATPDRVTLRSPAFYLRRIDLEEESWMDLIHDAKGRKHKASPDYISELWLTLYHLCRVKDAELDAWRESAEALLKNADLPLQSTDQDASSVTTSVCPDERINSFVRLNWGMFAERHMRGKGGDVSSSSLEMLNRLASDIELESASVIYDAFDVQYRRDLIDATVTYSSGLNITGSMRGVRDPLFFELDYDGFDEGDDVTFSMSADSILNVSASGTLSKAANGKSGLEVAYTGKGELTDPSGLQRLFISETGLFRGLSYDQPMQLTFSGSADSGGITVDEGMIDSIPLKGSIKGAVRYEGGYDGDFDVSSVVRLSHADLDTLFAPGEQEEVNSFDIDTGGAAFRLPQMRLNLPRLLALHADIEAENITFRQKEISGFVLEADIYSGRASLHRMELNLPGNSVFTLDGYVQHNGTRPLFLGRVRASGEYLREVMALAAPDIAAKAPERLLGDFSLKADVRMTPVSMMVDDILLTFDNASLRGNLTLDYIDTTSASNITLTLDRFDADLYGVTAYVLDELSKSGDSTYMDSANVEAYIRNISSQMRFVLRAEEGRFNRRNIRRAEMIVDYSPGVFSIDKFFVEDSEKEPSRKTDINAFARLTTPENGVPTAKISWKSGYLNTDMFFKRGALENMLADSRASGERPYPYFIFDRFNADYTFAVDNLYHSADKIASSIYLQGESRSAIMRISELRARIFGSAYLAAKARISMTRIMSLGVSFSLLRMPLDKVSQYLPDVFRKEVTGRLNLQGKIQTSGIGKRQLLSRLNAEGSFEAQNVKIKGLDLKRIYASSVNTISVVDVKQEIQRGLTQGETEFNSVTGNIKTSRAKEPFQMQLRDVTLKTPYSLSNYVMNYNAADNIFYSILVFGFRPAENESLQMKLSAQKNADGTYITEIEDSDIIRFVTAKTEGVN